MNKLAEIRKSKVYQKNVFLQAKKDYDVLELRLLYLLMSRIKPHLKNRTEFDENFRTFKLTAAQTVTLFTGQGATRNDLYERVKQACVKMAKSTIYIGTPKKFKVYPVFQKIEFDSDEGLTMCFNSEMKPFLLELTDGDYTITQFQDTLILSSSYAINLLFFLLEFKYKRKDGVFWREISIDDLRFLLNVDKDLYKGRIDNFKRRVLDAPIKEINTKLPMYHINYDTLKVGKRVVGIRFHIKLVKQQHKQQAEVPCTTTSLSTPEEKFKKRLVEVGELSEPIAADFLNVFGIDYCRAQLEFVRPQKNTANNFGGLVHDAIINDYAGYKKGLAKTQKVKSVQQEQEKEERGERMTKEKLDEMFSNSTSPFIHALAVRESTGERSCS